MTQMFYSREDMTALFLTVNNELYEINQWFALTQSQKTKIFIFP